MHNDMPDHISDALTKAPIVGFLGFWPSSWGRLPLRPLVREPFDSREDGDQVSIISSYDRDRYQPRWCFESKIYPHGKWPTIEEAERATRRVAGDEISR
jgi:hypothetical protein